MKSTRDIHTLWQTRRRPDGLRAFDDLAERAFWWRVARVGTLVAVTVPAFLVVSVPVLAMLTAPQKLAVWVTAWVLAGATYLGVVLAAQIETFQQGRTNTLARWLEQHFPDLEGRLTTLRSVTSPRDVHPLLLKQVEAELSQHASSNDWLPAAEPWPRLRLAHDRERWLRRAVVALAMIVSLIVAFLPGPTWAPNNAAAGSSIAENTVAAQGASLIEVLPGNIELERGTSLTVSALFNHRPNLEPTLEWRADSDGGATRLAKSLPMAPNLQDPLFVSKLPSLDQSAQYRVTLESQVSEWFSAKVYDLPECGPLIVTLNWPAYAGRSPEVVSAASAVSIAEGGQVELMIQSNIPLKTANLVSPAGTRVPLTADGQGPNRYRAVWSPEKTTRFQLVLTSEEGRTNREPPELAIQVLPNDRPQLASVFPGTDVRISAIEELEIESTAKDDYGLKAAELVIERPTAAPLTVPLEIDGETSATALVKHLVPVEGWGLGVGDIVSYYVRAIDDGPDSLPRETNSELHFAEVRPFEEIFREMQGAAAGAGENKLEKLIQQQKDVIGATWKVSQKFRHVRKNATTNAPTGQEPSLADDVRVLGESQAAARTLLKEIAASFEDARRQAAVLEADRAMADALGQLQRVPVNDPPSAATQLDVAVKTEQQAYQKVLSLRSSETVMGEGQGKGSSPKPAAQNRALSELELKNNRDRYETARQAEKGVKTAAAQQLELLDRLKELAQRQAGLNDQLRDFQRQAAEGPETAERRLKRLRDEQQELLQAADEIGQSLRKSAGLENRQKAIEGLSQARQALAKSTEALAQSEPSNALDAGREAADQLGRLQDTLRQSVSGQIAETLRNLRSAGKQLRSDMEDIQQQFDNQGNQKGESHSLRGGVSRDELADNAQQLKGVFESLRESVGQAVEQVERAEPLASDQLFSGLKQSEQLKTGAALSAAATLERAGSVEKANQALRAGAKGVAALTDSIDRATESILGNELESLKRAQRELALLTAAVAQELEAARKNSGANAAPGAEGDQPANSASTSGQTPGKSGPSANGQGKESGSGQSSGAGQSAEAGAGPAGAQSRAESGGSKANVNEKTPGGRSLRGSGPGKSPGAGESSGTQPGDGQSSGEEGQGAAGGGGPGNGSSPFTGGGYQSLSQGLREVESLLGDPKLQQKVARIRGQAKSVQAESKRHSKKPNWNLVEEEVIEPLVELQRAINSEIARRESPYDAPPAERDPVPARYRSLVEEYYQRLGSSDGDAPMGPATKPVP